MQHAIHYSLKRHLEETFADVPIVWVYDGVTLPVVKPFLTVEQMQNNNEVRSKGRETIETIFRFQIGMFASNTTEKSRMQSQINNALNFELVTLYQTSISPPSAVGFFNTLITSEVPMTWEDTEAETKKHRVYFTVEIPFKYGKNTTI